MKASAQYGRFGSGKAVRRVEDESLLKGAGQFVDDHNCPGRRTCCSCARPMRTRAFVGIDTKAAAAMPGVVSIVTGQPTSCAPA